MDFLSGHYLAIKFLHVLTAVGSIALFTLRFVLLMRGSAWRDARWIRTIPHLNDSALLLFAILLCLIIQQAPGTSPWLTEKVIMVVLYILAGMFTLRWAKGRPARIIWFIIAISLFVLTANIAVTKTPLML